MTPERISLRNGRVIGSPLEEADGPLTDAQLAAALKVGHQTVNQTCHTLEGPLRRLPEDQRINDLVRWYLT
jgi:hypothetical protein